MAMTPLGGRPPLHPGPKPSALSPQEERAYQAERDATKRIAEAEKDVEDAHRVADQRLDSIRDEYVKKESDESGRLQEEYEKQRMKGYEQIRELKLQQEAEARRVRREGERDLQQLQSYYRDTAYATERHGKELLNETVNKAAHELDYETRTREDEVKVAQEQHHRQTEDIRAGHEAKLNQLQESTHQEYERIKENSGAANRKADQTFQEQFAEHLAENDRTLLDLSSRAGEQIRDIRKDYSQKLAAYAARQEDPFYKLLDLNAKLREHDGEYVLTATIPVHEQKGVSVAVKGDQLVLSGYRRNEEKLELEPGRVQGTNAFQSFLETFPITWPVDANRLTREFDGDTLTVRIPKKSNFVYKSPVKPSPARARVERPKFPENLPLAKADASRTNSEEPLVPVTPTAKRKGSKPLT